MTCYEVGKVCPVDGHPEHNAYAVIAQVENRVSVRLVHIPYT